MEGFNSLNSPNMVTAGMSGSDDYMSRLLSFRQSDVDRDNMIQVRRYHSPVVGATIFDAFVGRC